MNNLPRLLALAFIANALLGLSLTGCGRMDAKDLLDGERTSPSMLRDDTGNYNLSCGGRGGSYAKQSPFKQSAQNSSCQASQKLQFPQKKIGEYDVDLNCSARKVVVHNRGADQKQQELPIQSNGKVQGKLQYQQAIQNDGKGNQSCWVKYEVDFNGKADCNGSTNSPDYPAVRVRQNDRLKLETRVSFKMADIGELLRSGIVEQNPDQNPGQNPGPQNPGPQNPGPQNPGPQHPGPQHPGPQHPMPTQKPIVVCEVQDPCPMVGSTEMSCGD